MKIRLTLGLMLTLAISGFAQYSKIPQNKLFIIQSAMNYGKNTGGCWDIPGGKNPQLSDGKNVEMWEMNGGEDQYFKFAKSSMSGCYEMYVSYNSRYRVNVDGGSSKNGTNVELWTNNSNVRQNFKFKHLGNGRFKIYTSTGKILTLSGRSSNNGSNIHVWDDHNGGWTEWYLLDAKTKKKYVPVIYPKTPEFFTKNKDKVFKRVGSTLVGTQTAYCKIIASGSSWVDIYSRTEGWSEAQGKNTVSHYTSRLYYDKKTGKYSTRNADYPEDGMVSRDKTKLTLSGEQSSVTYSVSNEPISKVFEATPVFFENNKDKTFYYSEAWMTGENVGTATIKNIEGNKITFLITLTESEHEKGKTKELVLNYTDGRYGTGAVYSQMEPQGYINWRKKELRLRGEDSNCTFRVLK